MASPMTRSMSVLRRAFSSSSFAPPAQQPLSAPSKPANSYNQNASGYKRYPYGGSGAGPSRYNGASAPPFERTPDDMIEDPAMEDMGMEPVEEPVDSRRQPYPRSGPSNAAARPTTPSFGSSIANVPTPPALEITYPFPEELEMKYDLDRSWTLASHEPLPPTVLAVLNAPLDPHDVEIKPDGILYMPEIRYRQILFKAFGPAGWALLPRGPHSLQRGEILSREYMLVAHGRLISTARGAATYRSGSQVSMPTLAESVKSNALVRCCKDLGIAHDLWNPAFKTNWVAQYAERRVTHDSYGRSKTFYAKKSF